MSVDVGVAAPLGVPVGLGLAPWERVYVCVGDADCVRLGVSVDVRVAAPLGVPVGLGLARWLSVDVGLGVDDCVFVVEAVRVWVSDLVTLAVRVCDCVVSAVRDTPR